jgi:Zinc finger, C2H2 type
MTYDCKQYIMQFNLFAIKFKCKICGMKFKTNAELTQHHRTVHSNISR